MAGIQKKRRPNIVSATFGQLFLYADKLAVNVLVCKIAFQMLIFTAGERKFIQKPFMICSAVGLLFIFLVEKVGVGTRVEHHENKFPVVLFPNKQPIGLNVTFPLPFTITM